MKKHQQEYHNEVVVMNQAEYIKQLAALVQRARMEKLKARQQMEAARRDEQKYKEDLVTAAQVLNFNVDNNFQ